MFIAILAVLFLFALAGTDLFVAQYNSEELSNMGIQQK
jgi:hypothetical protein